ncbi:MAG: trypsin-like peptidase domain-containing protein [Clostridium sp.]|uniref:trypsin-like peptidase domain-containing protein n=1 Tax=Clostridium sp. TaxID=1506 RepID=UPI003F2E9CC3
MDVIIMFDINEFLKSICQFNFQTLISKSNVVGLCPSTKIINEVDTGIPCLTVLVNQKIPSSAINILNFIPPVYCGVPTDVIEVGDFKPFGLTSKVRPFKGGYSIGTVYSTIFTSTGTGGCVVRDSSNYYILTNHHVVSYGVSNPLGMAVYQPSISDGGSRTNDIIGTVSKYIPRKYSTLFSSQTNLIDAALIKISPSNASNIIANIGAISGVNPNPTVGMYLQKSGRTSGLTTGVVKALNATVSFYDNGQRLVFTNQILTTPFMQNGDSGSVALDTSNKIVGLCFSGSDSMSVINPITTVFNLLNVTLP